MTLSWPHKLFGWLQGRGPKHAFSRAGRFARYLPSLEIMEDRTLLSTGGMDNGFGTGGKATVAFDLGGNFDDEARSIALQPDGKMVLAGSAQTGPSSYTFAVARLTPTGQLDTGFNGAGKQTIAFGLGQSDRALGLAVQADGKIVVAGTAQTANGYDFAVARLTSTGQPDTTFNGTGKQVVSFGLGGDNDDEATGVVLQPDGKIVVVGFAQVLANYKTFALARINANGSLDTTFNHSGKLAFSFSGGAGIDEAHGVAIQPDGKIVVVGFTQVNGANTDFAMARLNADGTFDLSFNNNGHQVVPFDLGGGRKDVGRAVALQADGKIVVAGAAERLAPNYDFAVVRLLPNGALDSTFSGTGKTTIAFDLGGGNDDEANTVIVQPSGKILVGGFAERFSPNYDFAVARLTANGSLDSGFGTGGKDVIPFDLDGGTNQDEAFSIALQPDGKALVAGMAQRSAYSFNFAVARVDTNNIKFFAVGGAPGRLDLFKPDGTPVISFAPFANYTGPISVALGDVNGDGVDDLVVAALTGNPHVKVFDGAAFASGTFNPANPDASVLAQWFAYALQFNVGANVAVGDIEGNGYADIVTGASQGNPHVRVYRGKDIAMGHFNPVPGGSIIAEFFPYALQFNVGANVAVGNVSGSGFADIVTGATIGNPHVKIYRGQDIATNTFNPDASIMAQFFAYNLNFNVGAYVAVGDTNGDGFADVITGATIGNPQVKVYDGKAIAKGTFNINDPNASMLNQFFAYDVGQNLGVSIGAADFENDGLDDILVGRVGTGAGSYRVVRGNATGLRPPAVRSIEGTSPDITGGVMVGA
jgi:uncharacterized delta-60 repeat protein